MNKPDNSPVICSFERGVAELQRLTEAGDIGFDEATRRYGDLLESSLANGTNADREYFYGLKLKTHQVGAEILARSGSPVPGNDPQKPN